MFHYRFFTSLIVVVSFSFSAITGGVVLSFFRWLPARHCKWNIAVILSLAVGIMRRTTAEIGELCLRHQKCDTQGAVSIVFLSTAAVTETLLHTKSEFNGNLESEFPLQFNLSCSIKESQSGDLRFLYISRTFWKYLWTCDAALALKYRVVQIWPGLICV